MRADPPSLSLHCVYTCIIHTHTENRHIHSITADTKAREVSKHVSNARREATHSSSRQRKFSGLFFFFCFLRQRICISLSNRRRIISIYVPYFFCLSPLRTDECKRLHMTEHVETPPTSHCSYCASVNLLLSKLLLYAKKKSPYFYVRKKTMEPCLKLVFTAFKPTRTLTNSWKTIIY